MPGTIDYAPASPVAQGQQCKWPSLRQPAGSPSSGLDACIVALEPGDTRLDRLGRSMPHLVGLVEDLLGKSIGFRSLQDGAIDTTTTSGDLMFNIFSSLAQFERRLIQERAQAGLAAARSRGRLGGRNPISPDDPRVVSAKRLHKDRSISIDQICATLGISRPTFYRYLALTDEARPTLSLKWKNRLCMHRVTQ